MSSGSKFKQQVQTGNKNNNNNNKDAGLGGVTKVDKPTRKPIPSTQSSVTPNISQSKESGSSTGALNKSAHINPKIGLRDTSSPDEKLQNNQEPQKTIHRVNLIKKSSRQPSFTASLASRRLIKQQQQLQTKLLNQENLVTNGPVLEDNKNNITTYKQAKESQELVVSLIRDIGKTVSKEDFSELSKQIQLALGQAEKENQKQSANEKSQHDEQAKDNGVKRKNSNQKPTGKLFDSTKVNQSNDRTPDKKKSSADTKQSSERQTISMQIIGDTSSNDPNPKSCKFFELSSDDDNPTLIKSFDERGLKSSRLPDRCLRLTSSHAKFISPHRKRSLEDRLRRAQESREKFLEYRANKFKEILKKVEEVRAWKEEDTLNLKASVQTKLQKAAEKRREQLDKIIRKAHDEDSKVSEIQFINSLEAQNRRYDLNSRKKEMEARLQDLQEERQRKIEEKQAKEVAAEERRKTIEAERKAKLLEIQQRRKIKNQKVEQQQQVREKKRIEKNRDRDQKINAIKEAFHNGVQSLRNRIDQKQEQSERRHEVNLRLIRQKAFELSIKRYNSFIAETKSKSSAPEAANNETNRLQLKPFNTKKFCNLCKETIASESALFSHLRSETHHASIGEHYGNKAMTTNEAVEIYNLRHITDTQEPIDENSESLQSSRASSLVNYYHSSYLSQANGDIYMNDNDRVSLLAIEKKCRKLRHKLIVNGKPFNKDWFSSKIRQRLARLLIQQRQARNQSTSSDENSLANLIDLSANNSICQQNKQIYLKITRINRELVSVATDQRISGGGLMPAGVIHTVDRSLSDLNKQLSSRQLPQLSRDLLYLKYTNKPDAPKHLNPDQLAAATKMIEFYAIDTLFLYDIVLSLVSILRRIVPNVSLTSKLPSTFASNISTMIDPISLNSYYCHRLPTLPPRIYIKMINLIQSLTINNSDLCYMVFQSNNIISLSDILSYRLGFIIGNESPASSISGSSSAATIAAHNIDNCRKQHQVSSGYLVGKRSPSNISAARETITSSSGKNKGSKSKRNEPQKSDQMRKSRLSQHSNNSNEQSHSIITGHRSNSICCEDDDEDDDDCNEVDSSEDEGYEFWGERAETYKRTEEIVDDMTAGLCKLLATITETILDRPLVLLDQIDKGAFHQRSDDFISYMVSVGIVDTESVIMSHVHQQQYHNHQKPNQNNHQQSASSNGPLGSTTTTTTSNSTTSNTNSNGGAHTSGNIGSNINSASSAMLDGGTFQSASIGHSNSVGYGKDINASSSATTHNMSLSANNKIINFTTSCVQFVTSLVKLVIAKLPDEGRQEATRKLDIPTTLANKTSTSTSSSSVQQQQQQQAIKTQQDSTQLLETLKMTQLSGVLTLVYDILVNCFNSLDNNNSPPQTGIYSAGISNSQTISNDNNNICKGFINSELLENQLKLALYSLKLINYVAYIDVTLVQSTLSSDEMLPLQLRHVCNYLISYLLQSSFKIIEHLESTCLTASSSIFSTSTSSSSGGGTAAAAASSSSGEASTSVSASTHIINTNPITSNNTNNMAPSDSNKASDLLANELMNEIILLLGNFAYLNQDNQLMLKSGRQPTVIEQLIGLPFDYFARSKLKLVLMPTLISCSYLNDQICAIFCQELSLSMLTGFIEDQLLGAQLDSAASQSEAANNRHLLALPTTDLTNPRLGSTRWTFEHRFAKCKWLSVKKYFEQMQASNQIP